MASVKTHGKVLSLGSVNADFQVRVDQQPGDKTTMLAHDFVRLSGGKASNVAYLAQLLGASALLIARVGNDDLQLQALRSLQDIGVDLSYVKKVDEASTGVSMIIVPPNGKKSIILSTNANDQWQQEDGDEVKQIIQQSPAGSVLVVNYEIPPFIVEQAINAAHEQGFSIILDPSPAERVNRKLYSKISYIVPDASEAEDLTGIRPDSVDAAVRAAQKFISDGVNTAMIKLEDGGCVAASKEIILHIPPVSVEVEDTTGAGDAFAGALATAVLEGHILQDAACYATAASLAAVKGYGSQPAYPSRDQLQELFCQVSANVKNIDVH